MLKSLMHEAVLSVQSRTGITASLLVLFGIIALATLTAFVFLCVAGFDWFALQFGSIYAGLLMAGIFILIALVCSVLCVSARRRVRERAILERAARAHAPSWLLDPKILATAVQVGRTVGWQRIVPIALAGFMAAQWARDYREQTRARETQ